MKKRNAKKPAKTKAKGTGPSGRTPAQRDAIDARAKAWKRPKKTAPKAKPKPKPQPLAPAFARMIDAGTGKPFGPTKAEAKKLRADVLKLKDKLTPAERKELLKLAPRPADTRWPSEIDVGKRYRKAMGDLDATARSIERGQRNGEPLLLQAVGINPKDQLIFGERRLEGWRRSKFALTHPIPVRVLDVEIIEGEWIENDPNLRKNFTPEEAVEIVRAMRPRQRALVGAEAAERPSETRAAPGRPAAPGRASGRVADRAAAVVGKDRKTIAKAEAIVDAAAQDPQRFGPLRDDMNRTGKVDGPFRRLEIMQATDKIRTAPPPLPGNGPYSTMVIDFPWPFEGDAEQEEIDAAGRSLRPYPAMSIKSGCHFLRDQVVPLLAPDCTVWFWVTNHHLVKGYHAHLLAALGFPDGGNTKLTWVKMKDGRVQIGRGQILRDATEDCIVLTRGKAVINVLGEDPPTTVLFAPRRDNSQKPEEFYRLVERVSPAARYASIFSTGGEGALWDGHGDQVEKHAPAAATDELTEWKALGAIEGDVTITGSALNELHAGKLIAGDTGRVCGWSLTEAGTDRLAVLEAKFNPPAPDAAEQERQLLDLLETIAAVPETPIDGAEPWLKNAIAPLVTGKRKLKINGEGKKRRADLHKRLELAWLEAVEAGEGEALPVYARVALKQKGHVQAMAAKKLTVSGKRWLGSRRDDKTRDDLVASLPNDVPALTALYLDAIRDRHARILAGDKTAVSRDAAGGPPDSRADAIIQKAIDLGRAQGDPDEWPDVTIRKSSRAPIGEVPMWGQQGIFRVVVDGLPVLCFYTPDEWFEDIGFFAEDGERGFISETGYHKAYEDAPLLGCTVAQYAEGMIRQELALEPAGPRTVGKRKQRKSALPLPKVFYSLPADWSEIVHDTLPVAGGKVTKSKKRPKGAAATASPAEDHPQPADRADDAAPAEKKKPPRSLTFKASTVRGKAPPDGHWIALTIDDDGELTTCQCGATFRVQDANWKRMEDEILAHWTGALDQAAIDDFEKADLYRVPQDVIDAIGKLGGHVISRTIDHSEGEKGFSVATCQCGKTFRADRTLPYSGENEIAPREAAHWRDMLLRAEMFPAAPAPARTGQLEMPEIPAELDRRDKVA